MILEINAFHQVNGRKLMDIYGESNRENTSYFYPEITDINEALAKVECDYLHYIETDFLANRQNRYIILEHDGIWVCGLRLCQIDDSLYYIEALETHPEHRNKLRCGTAFWCDRPIERTGLVYGSGLCRQKEYDLLADPPKCRVCDR